MKIVSYLFSVVVLSVLLISSALAMTPIGPPAATLDQGQFAAGFSYAYSKGDLESTVDLVGLTATVKDVESDTYMANILFGITTDLLIQIDLGASDTEYDVFSSSGDFAGGFGIKGTFVKSDKLKFGAAITAHWYKAEDRGIVYLLEGPDGPMSIPWTEKNKWRQVQLAIGPTYKDGAFCFYGGPFVTWIDGESDWILGGVDLSGDFEEKSNFGGFVGTQIDMSDNVTLNVEYQLMNDAYVLTTGILHRF